MLEIILSSLLVFSNPCEQIETISSVSSAVKISLDQDNVFYSQESIYIEKVIKNENGYFVVIITENNEEYVLTGLHEIFVEKGKHYNKGQKIGIDFTLSEYPTFIVCLYRNISDFPQLINNKASFLYPEESLVYSIESGVIQNIGHDPLKGVFITLKPDKVRNLFIDFCNLKTTKVKSNQMVKNTEEIGTLGITGLTNKPKLTLFFHTNEYSDDFRIIFLKAD